VRAGEPFTIETEDASRGLLAAADRPPTPETTPYVKATPGKGNPVGGPVFVDGVKAGQCVRIDILDITIAPTGACWSRPSGSPFGDSRAWNELAEPFTVAVTHADDGAKISDRLRWRLAPMVGTIACAPEWEVRSTSLGQGPWGGNLDITDLQVGSSIFLNSYHDGGLVYLGDVHGCQGAGEYIGGADETRAEVTVRVAPADFPPLPSPRLITPETVTAVHIARPLEAAAHGAARHLMSWLCDEYGFSQRDAYLIVGLHPDFRFSIYQMTAIEELRFVVGASLPREYLDD
jgi:acetamidase/formamidase